MKSNVNTKIVYQGKEYSDPNQLPPEIRDAYQKAISEGRTPASTKIVFNGEEFTDTTDMPNDIRRLCEDVMSVIENNGEVTLPGMRWGEPLLTKRQLRLVLVIVGVLFVTAMVVLAKTLG